MRVDIVARARAEMEEEFQIGEDVEWILRL